MRKTVVTVAVLLAGWGAAPAQAQATGGTCTTDWCVYSDATPATQCWAVSVPKTSEAKRDGKKVSVNRGDVGLFVSFTKGKTVGEVSFTGGYPFAEGSAVTLDIDGTDFDLPTKGEFSWTDGPETDKKVIEAFKSGGKAVATGKSGKGTQTTDSFSLSGFTAAVTEAAKRCQ